MRDLKKNFLNSFKNYWPIIAIISIVLIFFYQVIFLGKIPLSADALVAAHVPWTEVKWPDYPAGVPFKNLEISDSFSAFYPWRSLVGEFWKAGKVPLWNMYTFSGTPLLATLHSAALYPLNTFYLITNSNNAWSLLVISQVLIALISMYAFLRYLKLENLPALLGAIIFAFCGYMMGWLEFTTGSHAGIWLPLLLLFEHRLITSGKINNVLVISILYFFIFTAGDFQVPLYIVGVYLFFGAMVLWKNFSIKKVFMTIFPLVLGGLLAAPQLVPTFELFRNSIRQGDNYIKDFNFGLMGWEKITNFIWPDFYGNPVTGNFWGKYTYNEFMGFTGVVSLIFVSFSLLSKKIWEEKIFLIILGLSLLLLFPNPISYLPYQLGISGLSTSSASRILFVVDFCLAVLAAYGFSKWKDSGLNKRILEIIVVLSGVTIVVGLLVFKYGGTANYLIAIKNMIPSTLVLLAIGLLILATQVINKETVRKITPFLIVLIAVFELFRFAWKTVPFSPQKFVFPETKITRYLDSQDGSYRVAGRIPMNLLMPFNIESIEGYDPLYSSIVGKWISAMDGKSLSELPGRYGNLHEYNSSLINITNTKYFVDYLKDDFGVIDQKGNFDQTFSQSKFKKVEEDGRVAIFENTSVYPRVWLSQNIEYITDQNKIISRLEEITQKGEKVIILDKEENKVVQEKDFRYKINSFKEGFNNVEVNVESSGSSYLFLSQSYYPGWVAQVDGKVTKINQANFAFDAIYLPSGVHKVEFIYDPLSFKMGKWICLSAVVIILLVFLNEQIITKRH